MKNFKFSMMYEEDLKLCNFMLYMDSCYFFMEILCRNCIEIV